MEPENSQSISLDTGFKKNVNRATTQVMMKTGTLLSYPFCCLPLRDELDSGVLTRGCGRQ